MSGKVLVTGATGLLGRHIVNQLIEAGRSVRVLIRKPSQRVAFDAEVDAAIGDIRSSNDVSEAVRNCESVIHACSSHQYNLDPASFFAINVIGTKNVCDAVSRWGCRRLVVTSTVSTLSSVSRPRSTIDDLPPRKRMSVTKQLAEEAVLSRVHAGLPAVVVNPAYFIGPMDECPSPFRLWIPLAIRTPVRFVPAGGFNVLGATDVARFHLWALEHGTVGERYPITGENISLRDYVARVNSAVGHSIVPRTIPTALLRTLAVGRVFDRYTAGMISQENYLPLATNTRVPQQSLSTVIADTVEWFKQSGKLKSFFAIARFIWKRYV